VQKQGRQQQTRCEIEPENGPVERIELARKVEGVKNERSQTDKIEMQGMWRPGSFQQYENADEKID
jgi:hypothetical protein